MMIPDESGKTQTNNHLILPLMEERLDSGPSRGFGRIDTEFRYIVQLRAVETFTNLMRRQGISIPDNTTAVSFASNRLLNMKLYKEIGLVWSYSIIEVRRKEDLVEEG
jgi:hypothetical protein